MSSGLDCSKCGDRGFVFVKSGLKDCDCDMGREIHKRFAVEKVAAALPTRITELESQLTEARAQYADMSQVAAGLEAALREVRMRWLTAPSAPIVQQIDAALLCTAKGAIAKPCARCGGCKKLCVSCEKPSTTGPCEELAHPMYYPCPECQVAAHTVNDIINDIFARDLISDETDHHVLEAIREAWTKIVEKAMTKKGV